VQALTGAHEPADSSADLADQMARAAREVDDRTAHAFAKALLDSLCEDPANVRQLEALIVLGLAHPEALARRGISVSTEGRRLAIMLEQQGEADRATCLQELLTAHAQGTEPAVAELDGFLRHSSEGEDLVEQYMERATRCASRGRTQEAVSWLEEVLLIDRSRRDVARMIRDLRYHDVERKVRRRKIARGLFLFLIGSSIITSLVFREVNLHKEWLALPHANPATIEEVQARLAAVEGMIARNRVWVDLFDAQKEQDELRGRIEGVEASLERSLHEAELEMEHAARMAEAARLSGLMNVELGRMEEAVEDFRRCLSLAEADWSHRPRVEADLKAIEEKVGMKQ
jgi:tetratricopeptide (TPR) repeat protein